jgi:hypothetical protein
MLHNTIPIDFVAGSHGHFLEVILNTYFNITNIGKDQFTTIGTSHYTTSDYIKNRIFHAHHWNKCDKLALDKFPCVISIRYSQDDLLLLSSVSLLRAADQGIDNDTLEINTVGKLNNAFYKNTLELIYQSYPFLDRANKNIPRYVLREFYKFGFKTPDINGYWLEQKKLQYTKQAEVFYFNFDDFYNINLLVSRIKELELFLNKEFNFSIEFYRQHQKFMSFIPYINHKQVCDNIISYIKQCKNIPIPKLTLFQESYINGNLENVFNKEMPFNQNNYFTSTEDVLYYINNCARTL